MYNVRGYMSGNDGKIGAVMVVGGGIAGMQAALDLANAGYFVYLVEYRSAIGGRMAQLDKTFPTNDCSMCTISPRLVEVGTHANIEMITHAEVESLEGEPGRFRVRLSIRPRFIDPEKCTGCGLCAEKCPVPVKDEYNQLLGDRRAVYKLYPQAVPNKYSIDRLGVPPCYDACPVHGNPSGYVALAAAGRYQEAFEAAVERNPFPSICGRVCVRHCEHHCNRANLDGPVAVASLKRFLADWNAAHGKRISPEEKRASIRENGKKVAVVGAGPAGLAAALELRKRGYAVTVFDRQPRAGGMMSLAIPAYRLPDDVVQRDIQGILDYGVELRLNHSVSGAAGVEALFREGFEAVFLGVGAWTCGRLRLPGEDLPEVSHGVNFLRDVRLGKKTSVRERVIVIGGGNVAIDCARTARRLGAKSVEMFCLETRAAMPAHPWEIEWAVEEGVVIHDALAPKRIIDRDGRFAGLETLDVESMSFKEGKLDLKTRPGTEKVFAGDELIIAIGQRPETGPFKDDGRLRLTPRGTFEVDKATLMTSWPGVFAGGDAVRGAASIVEAIADGRRAAQAIDARLSGAPAPAEPLPERIVTLSADDLRARKEKRRPRQAVPTIPLERRVSAFDEVELGFSEDQARMEAQRCLYCATCSYCRQCEKACEAKAIRFDDAPSGRTLEVGAVILAPGFDLYDATGRGEYGYRRFPNVVTNLDYERMLSASGPFHGHIRRISDGREPKRIAFIQCVGSRDEEHPWCSSICCMAATKQAIITKEHLPDASCTVFVMDVRAFGKGFDEYVERAKAKYGVRYVHTRPSQILQDYKTRGLRIQYSEDGRNWQEETFDLVILSAGLRPPAGADRLAAACGVGLTPHGFARSVPFRTAASSREGVFLAGALEEPKDIPESVTQASAAAALAMEFLAEARGTRVKERAYPPEKDVGQEQARVGVFVCHCGSNIGGFIDCERVAREAARMPGVAFATHLMYTCSPDGLKAIREKIEEHRLNRVVVASCTPRTHETLFQRTIREAGLNAYLFEMANIRDQCTWVHARMGDLTERKALDLVRMAVARARTLEPLQAQTYVPKRRALVVGGGPAGMAAAVSIARQGYPVDLVEKSDRLGGNLHRVRTALDGARPADLLASLQRQVRENPLITVHLRSEVEETKGFVGNFTSKIRSPGGVVEVEHGAAIIATGADELKPAEYLYGRHPRVFTQQEFEAKMEDDPAWAASLREVVMIQCVGSREPDRMVCCRVGCTEALKNALALKDRNPSARVAILYRDLRAYGFKEEHYTEARRRGILFFRFEREAKPEVCAGGDGPLRVRVNDLHSGLELAAEPDALVLSAGMKPSPESAKVGTTFKVPLTLEGFFLEAHMKLRPVDFASEGLFLCGTCHGPKFIDESVAQAQAAAARAVSILSRPVMEVGGVVSKVNPDLCAACLTCVRTCPYGVPRINADGVAEIEAAMCHGCGVCAAECPAKAIELMHYKDRQIVAKTDALLGEEREALRV